MKGKTRTIAAYPETGFYSCSHSRERKNPSYSQINMINLFPNERT